MKVVIILPTYNERKNIVLLLNGLHEACSKIKNHEVSYLVVDDNSPDGTQKEVELYRKTHKDVHLIKGEKHGLGKALLRGMAYATSHLEAQILAQMDADLSHDPKAFPLFLNEIDNGAEFVIGSRYIPHGSIPDNWGIHRKIFSVVGNAVVRFGLGFLSVRDWTGGYRAYKKIFFEQAKDKVKAYSGYVFQIAFLHNAAKSGANIVEVPIQFADRRFGHSKIAPSQYIRDVLVYTIRERLNSLQEGPFLKFCVVGFIGFIINTLILEGIVRLGFHPVLGSILGAELAIVSNFILNNNWTFRIKKITGRRTVGKFIQFNLAVLGSVIIQAGTVAVGILIFGIKTYRAFYILGVGMGLIWNYFMYSRVVWKK